MHICNNFQSKISLEWGQKTSMNFGESAYMCVWWASRNLHEARTRLKLLLLSQRKTSRKRTYKTRKKETIWMGQNKNEKNNRNTHLQYDQQRQPFTWFRDHQQTVTCMIVTSLSQLSHHWLHQLSSAQLSSLQSVGKKEKKKNRYTEKGKDKKDRERERETDRQTGEGKDKGTQIKCAQFSAPKNKTLRRRR